jgi:hypothetical protein
LSRIDPAQFFRLLRLSLWQIGRQATLFPETTGFEELHAFATLEDATLGTDGTAGRFEAAMLRHNWIRTELLKMGAETSRSPGKRNKFIVLQRLESQTRGPFCHKSPLLARSLHSRNHADEIVARLSEGRHSKEDVGFDA